MRSISTDSACIARHRSSARPVILLYFTPASGLNSKVVTTGPGWICATWPSTANSLHFSSSWWASSISSRSSILRSTLGASSSACGGSVNVPCFRCAGAFGGSGSGSSDGVSSFLRATTGGTARGGRRRLGGLRRRLAAACAASAGAGRTGTSGGGPPFLVCLAITSRRAFSRRRWSNVAAHQPEAALRQVARAGRWPSRTCGRTRTASPGSPRASSPSAAR